MRVGGCRGGEGLSETSGGFPAARRVLPHSGGVPGLEGWLHWTAITLFEVGNLHPSENKEMKFKLKNLSSGESANSEEMQENVSFSFLRLCAFKWGPLAARKAGWTSLGKTQEERGQTQGRHSLRGSPSTSAPGAGSFLSIATNVLGSESDHCMHFPPLRGGPDATHTHAHVHPPSHTCATCACTHTPVLHLLLLPWGLPFSHRLGLD